MIYCPQRDLSYRDNRNNYSYCSKNDGLSMFNSSCNDVYGWSVSYSKYNTILNSSNSRSKSYISTKSHSFGRVTEI